MAKNNSLHGMVPDQSETALLVVDMFTNFRFPGGRKLRTHAKEIVPPILALKAKCGRKRIPTIYVNDNQGRWRSDQSLIVQSALERAPFLEPLRPREQDYFITKAKHSAFYGTSLDLLLRYLGARRLVITGIATDSCLFFSAADAFLRDFHLLLPRDCSASQDPKEKKRALLSMAKLFRADLSASSSLDRKLLR